MRQGERSHQCPFHARLCGRPTRSADAASQRIDRFRSGEIGQITVTPEFLSMEELSRLWSGLQARYRLSATYEASVVFVRDRRADRVGLSEVAQEISHERHSRS